MMHILELVPAIVVVVPVVIPIEVVHLQIGRVGGLWSSARHIRSRRRWRRRLLALPLRRRQLIRLW